MRVWLHIFGFLLLCAIANSQEEKPTNPFVYIDSNNFAKIGEPFQVRVSLSPATKSRVAITMDPTWGASFSQSAFVLGPGQRKIISGTVKKSVSGLAWIHASASDTGYDDGWYAVVVDFDGSLKLSSNANLPYESATTLTVTMIDGAGKPLRLPSVMELRLASADGLLSSDNSNWKNTVSLDMSPGSQTSPQVQIRPTSVRGGSVHLIGTLLISGQEQVLAQQEFPLNADPAWWLPVLLAVMGGLLHGIYKILRLPDDVSGTKQISKPIGIVAASGLAGVIGYFFAHLDLLGLKLDPNLLRSYPLIGFLFSYFGFEVLLPKNLLGRGSADEEDAVETPPKG
jgi:hypothetical protein